MHSAVTMAYILHMLWIIYYSYEGIKWERVQQVSHLISL